VKDQFTEFGWSIRKFEDKLTIIDAYSSLVGDLSNEKYVVSDPENIEDMNEIIIQVMKDIPSNEKYVVSDPENIEDMNEIIIQVMKDIPKKSVIIVGSLSTIMDLCGEEKTLEAIKLWNKMALLYDHVIIYNFTAWPYSESTIHAIKDELFTLAWEA
jgi:hypothetical protein